MNNLRRYQFLLLQEQLSEQNRDLREAHIKSLREMEELKRFQELRIDESSRRRLIENQDTINELTARIQELQNEVNCMNDSRDFKDAESVRSGLSHVPSQPALLQPFRDPGGNAEPQRSAAKTFGIRMVYRETFFCKSTSVFFITLSRRIQSVDFQRNGTCLSPHVTSERETPDTALDPRCQSGPSARNSFDPSDGRFPKNYGADQQRLQISDLHFDKFPNPATFACSEDKIQD